MAKAGKKVVALVPTSGQQTEPAVVDETAVAEALAEIKKVHGEATTLLQQAGKLLSLEIGRIVVDRFFDGSLDGLTALRKRGPKNLSYDKLAQHPELPIKKRGLRRAVDLYELALRSGHLEEVRTSALLGISHLEAVLPLAEEKQKKLLAQTVEHGWSVQRLKDQVKKTPRERKGGPVPKTAITKWVNALDKAATELAAELEGSASMDAEEAKSALAVAKRAMRSIISAQGALKKLAGVTKKKATGAKKPKKST